MNTKMYKLHISKGSRELDFFFKERVTLDKLVSNTSKINGQQEFLLPDKEKSCPRETDGKTTL